MKNTRIEWADHTFNPWIGCTQVSPGCDHCYAKAWDDRFIGAAGTSHWGTGATRKRTSAANWAEPLRWNAKAAAQGVRARVFCASLADVFDNEVDREWRDDLATLILNTPDLDWLLLTKRIGNAGDMLVEMFLDGPPDNVWLGATIVNQDEYDRDAHKLLKVAVSKRFLSIEPMLGPIHGAPSIGAFDWVIVGGESGHGARPMHPDWVCSLHDQCDWYSVPFFFKQWGEWREPVEGEEFSTAMGRAQPRPAFIVAKDGTVHCFQSERTKHGGRAMLRVGKKAAGRHLNGRTWDKVPTP